MTFERRSMDEWTWSVIFIGKIMIFSANANTPDVEKRVWCDFLILDSRIDEIPLRNWSKKDGWRGMDEAADTDATHDESTAYGSQISKLLLIIYLR